jgi:hypothetical protein
MKIPVCFGLASLGHHNNMNTEVNLETPSSLNMQLVEATEKLAAIAGQCQKIQRRLDIEAELRSIDKAQLRRADIEAELRSMDEAQLRSRDGQFNADARLEEDEQRRNSLNLPNPPGLDAHEWLSAPLVPGPMHTGFNANLCSWQEAAQRRNSLIPPNAPRWEQNESIRAPLHPGPMRARHDSCRSQEPAGRESVDAVLAAALSAISQASMLQRHCGEARHGPLLTAAPPIEQGQVCYANSI